jgi:hypothetical protein
MQMAEMVLLIRQLQLVLGYNRIKASSPQYMHSVAKLEPWTANLKRLQLKLMKMALVSILAYATTNDFTKLCRGDTSTI